MIIRSVELETVAGITSKMPENRDPEFAFLGKSNVGKSSLINALMNRKSLARVSQEPGKTATVNFYRVNGAFYLVDLPGYGYAKVSKETREKWSRMTERYLRNSSVLKQVFLLTDMRHEPPEHDLAMYRKLCSLGFRPVVIATKADKLSGNERAKMKQVLKKAFGIQEDGGLIPFSAVTKEGVSAVHEIIEKASDI